MRKVAVFVEGKAELRLVRDFLLNTYNWVNIGVECYELHASNLTYTQYHYPEEEASRRTCEHFYQIVNVGTDASVLSVIRKRLLSLYRENFEKVIGLRDMYCDDYHYACGTPRRIMADINQSFIDGHNSIIQTFPDAEKVKFFFAIMEVEAWFLAIPELFTRIDSRLTPEYIQEKLNVNLANDPETNIYHPAKTLGEILGLVGRKYGKHEHDISGILSHITPDDFEELMLNPNKCASFTAFIEELLP